MSPWGRQKLGPGGALKTREAGKIEKVHRLSSEEEAGVGGWLLHKQAGHGT